MNATIELVARLILILLATLDVALLQRTSKAEPMPETIRVMSFNLWHGGDAGRQPLEQTIAVIQASQADVVGLQETAGLAPEGEPRPDRAPDSAPLTHRRPRRPASDRRAR